MTASPTYSHLVITGGSSGIGQAILEYFLEHFPDADAINLSRSTPHLAQHSDRLHSISVDLTSTEARARAVTEVSQRLREHSSCGPVLLINNSGIGRHDRFQDIERDQHLQTIDLNIGATVDLTLQLLPALLELGGTIVSVSSTSSFQPTPYMSTYGGTKAFLLHWTLALGEDLRGTKVTTLALCPGATATPFIPQAGFEKPVRSFWGVQGVDHVVNALFTGLKAGKKVVVPGMRNRLIAGISKTAPIQISTRVAAWLMNWAKRPSSSHEARN